jgi:hypothetical protein
MKLRLGVFLTLCLLTAGRAARAQEGMVQEDYLTDGEISSLRDAQEPDKRMTLFMDFAQRRVDGVKQLLSAAKPDSGRDIQKSLAEYVHILEALEDTIDDAREHRVPMSKGLKDIQTRANLYLNFFKSVNSDSLPAWKDFHYTLDEAIAMTSDEIAEAGKGNFPEVKGRTPPNELPPPPKAGARPPSDAKPDAKPGTKTGDEEGPPRKSRPSQ